ncbi:MAG: DUF2497 domain-containing protein [Shinella sp.]|nr:MAG: DUF2497 domain-containing protein [Shinella sp.]
MAQPSVAREPSMEEILASIRRIIESNEPGAVPGASVVQSQPEMDYAADDEVTNQYVDAARPVVADSMGTPLRAANTAVPPRVEREASPVYQGESKPQSLADIAARVRNASERMTPPVPVMREEAPMPPEPVQHPSDIFGERAAPVQAQPLSAYMPEPDRPIFSEAQQQHRPSASASASLRASLQPHPQPQQASAVPSFEPAAVSAASEIISRYQAEAVSTAPVSEPVAVEIPENAPVYATYSEPEPEQGVSPAQSAFAPAVEASALSLLSSEAGVMVARSFGELAEAVDGAQRRSLDEMAEEMLRPMLREWLDDNLPTLVERLVREEIERVARGPRR